MKTIVIPAKSQTNFNKLALTAMSLYENDTVHCIFLDIRPLPDNYNDLLTLSAKRTNSTLADAAFYEVAANLKKTYNDKITVAVDFLYGDSSAVFKNYISFKEADLVIYDEQQWKPQQKSLKLNIFRMVSRCGCELMYISGEAKEENFEDVFKQNKHPKTEKPRTETHTGNIAIALNPAFEEAPQSLQYQFQAVDAMLNELQHNFYKSRILSKKLSNVSRYFLKETSLQKILSKSECSMMLIQK